jgi:hypothetical protein
MFPPSCFHWTRRGVVFMSSELYLRCDSFYSTRDPGLSPRAIAGRPFGASRADLFRNLVERGSSPGVGFCDVGKAIAYVHAMQSSKHDNDAIRICTHFRDDLSEHIEDGAQKLVLPDVI